jgi:hypothetical protein
MGPLICRGAQALSERIVLFFFMSANPTWLTGYLACNHDGLCGRVTNDTDEPMPMQLDPKQNERKTAQIERNDWQRLETVWLGVRHTARIGPIPPAQAGYSIDHACDAHNRGEPASE